MSRDGFLGHFGKYFDTDSLSDVIIRSGSGSIKAHRIALSQASPYFASCFERRFKEKNQPVIELKEDDPKAIRGLIAYAYGLNFDGENGYHKSRMLCVTGISPMEINFQVDLWVVATKYMFDELAQAIKGEFPCMLDAFAPNGDLPHALTKVAEHLYVGYKEATTELRPSIVKRLKESMGLLKTCEAFNELLRQSPDLACDMLWACHDDTGTKAAQSGSRKRKSSFSGLSDEIVVDQTVDEIRVSSKPDPYRDSYKARRVTDSEHLNPDYNYRRPMGSPRTLRLPGPGGTRA